MLYSWFSIMAVRFITRFMPHVKQEYQSVAPGRSTVKRAVLHQNWSFRKTGDAKWLPAQVPGNNFSDLLREGVIPDPFFRAHEKELQWIEQEGWEYRTAFDLDASFLALKAHYLVFKGLDTYADVFVNGQLLLSAENMFLEYEANVTSLLKAGSNEITIHFRSPIKEVQEHARAVGFTYPAGNDHAEEKLSVFTRKAPYHYGWDWGPRFVTSGVWRSVELVAYQSARLKQANLVTQALSDNGGRAKAEVWIEVVTKGSYTIKLDVEKGRWGVAQTYQLEPGVHQLEFELELEGAELWWPRMWGEPLLYALDWELTKGDQLIDEQNGRFGMCMIKLVREADAEGKSFYFEVNGESIFAKGANYIPQDNFLDRPTEAHYRKVFEDMAAANMNMVRIWGGGIYESDLFYDLADEYGIMVWQDFMFACTMYPGDPAFIDNVRAEAICNIRRLKGHPSLALWCGNNEIAVGWQYWGWQEEFGYNETQCQLMASDYERLFEAVLPELVMAEDPTRDYLPSSPIYDYSEVQDYNKGDVHYWGVWHEEAPFSTYKDAIPRFMSEYGFQSFPLLESVKRYTKPEDWSIESEVMQLHQKHPRGNGIIHKYLLEHFRVPKNFESFLYLSQLLQAEGIRIAIEAHRNAKPFCMGTLYWQLNDCWPVASWSGIDYYGQWKALHYAVGKAFSPLLAVVDTEGEDWSVTIVSDLPQDKHLRLRIGLYHLSGERLVLEEKSLDVNKNGKALMPLSEIQELAAGCDPADHWLHVQLEDGDEVVYDQTVFLVPVRSLNLLPPEIEVETETMGRKLTVRLTAKVLVKGLYVYLKGVQGNFSDNFFDLRPGATKTIVLTLPEVPDGGWPSVQLMSVYDSYTI